MRADRDKYRLDLHQITSLLLLCLTPIPVFFLLKSIKRTIRADQFTFLTDHFETSVSSRKIWFSCFARKIRADQDCSRGP